MCRQLARTSATMGTYSQASFSAGLPYFGMLHCPLTRRAEPIVDAQTNTGPPRHPSIFDFRRQGGRGPRAPPAWARLPWLRPMQLSCAYSSSARHASIGVVMVQTWWEEVMFHGLLLLHPLLVQELQPATTTRNASPGSVIGPIRSQSGRKRGGQARQVPIVRQLFKRASVSQHAQA